MENDIENEVDQGNETVESVDAKEENDLGIDDGLDELFGGDETSDDEESDDEEFDYSNPQIIRGPELDLSRDHGIISGDDGRGSRYSQNGHYYDADGNITYVCPVKEAEEEVEETQSESALSPVAPLSTKDFNPLQEQGNVAKENARAAAAEEANAG